MQTNMQKKPSMVVVFPLPHPVQSLRFGRRAANVASGSEARPADQSGGRGSQLLVAGTGGHGASLGRQAGLETPV